MRGQGGIEQPHQRGAGLARTGEVQEIARQRGPSIGAVQRQLVLTHALVERLDECLSFAMARLGQALAHRGDDRLQRDGVVVGDGNSLALGWFACFGRLDGFLDAHGNKD
ncbi:MAG: hypothetical protein ABIR55_12020, partial [Burkholderiaceae bacterium]